MFTPKDHLTNGDVQKGLQAVIRDGIASQCMGVLTSGVYLVEKIRNRRLITVLGAFISRAPWLLVALSPFVFASHVALPILIGAILVHAGVTRFATGAWNPWMKDLIPQETMGLFFSKRMRISIGLGLTLTLLTGLYLDWWKKSFPNDEAQGYSLLFLLGFLAGAVGVYFISRIPEPRTVSSPPGFFQLLILPFRNMNFKRLLAFLGPWNFSVNLAALFLLFPCCSG
jgi:hypothetical protein